MISGKRDSLWPVVIVEFSETRLPVHVDGALAVLTVGPPPDAWQQDALVRRVRNRGFMALAMLDASTFGRGTQLLADRLGLTLLDVDRPMELAHACWQLLQGRDSLTLYFVRKIAHSFEYRAENLASLLTLLASNLGYGIALAAADGVLLQAGGELPRKVLAAVDFGPWLHIVSNEHGDATSVRVDSPSRVGLRLVVFGQGLSDTQLKALGIAAEVMMPAIAARLLIDEVASVNDAAASSGLLLDFMEQQGAADPELEQRMRDRGWNTDGYHLAFRVTGRSRVDTFQLLKLVKLELTDLAATSHAVTSGRGVTGWLSFASQPVPRELDAKIAELRAIHQNLRSTVNIATGIGSLDNGPVGLLASINGASDAVRIAANRSSTGWFVRLDALGLEQLLLSWTENDSFMPAAQSLLFPLKRNDSTLLITLSSYLDQESSVTATATALGLHRNTVTTRIARAQDLLGLDLNDPETRLAVHLACRTLSRDG